MNEVIIETCGLDAITALDLRDEIEQARLNAAPIEAYCLTELDAEGFRKSVTGSMLWYPALGRAGIEWGSDAQWTDASSPEDALCRYREGDMAP
jgi:hypothetical protein